MIFIFRGIVVIMFWIVFCIQTKHELPSSPTSELEHNIHSATNGKINYYYYYYYFIND